MRMPRITFWRVILLILIVGGAYATWIRFTQGLGAVTNLSDDFPWGIWIGFDVLCGVMLAAGGFTLMATVHIFNAERFRSIVRPTLLTAFLGYLLVIVALMFDLGRPYRIWHPLVMWNPRSVMFEIGWCVTLYTTVLALEFSPIVFEKFRMDKALRVIRAISLPLVIAGVILSTLHQSSLGSLYLITPGKLHPLWYSPLLPVFFFLSALAVGIAMTIFESNLAARHLGHQLEPRVVILLGKILTVLLAFYGVMRLQDLTRNGAISQAFELSYESNLFLVEVGLGLILPLALLAFPRVRASTDALYFVSILVIFGFVFNRMNVSITGLEGWVGGRYLPAWTEIAVTLFIVAIGVTAFALATKYLPIFEESWDREDEETVEAVDRLSLPTPARP